MLDAFPKFFLSLCHSKVMLHIKVIHYMVRRKKGHVSRFCSYYVVDRFMIGAEDTVLHTNYGREIESKIFVSDTNVSPS